MCYCREEEAGDPRHRGGHCPLHTGPVPPYPTPGWVGPLHTGPVPPYLTPGQVRNLTGSVPPYPTPGQVGHLHTGSVPPYRTPERGQCNLNV